MKHRPVVRTGRRAAGRAARTKRVALSHAITDIQLPPSRAEVRSLDNGLEVLLQEDHSHPLASVQVWVKAGSLHEEKWTGAGLAHLVEHMLFKGTRKRSAQEISLAIQDLGGYVNAFTSFNRTVYWIDGLAEHVDGYLEVLADMTRHSKLDPEELGREMDVIRREMAMDNDDPSSTAQHLMQATAFRQHPLRHPVIGHREIFDQMGAGDVVAFVQRHYVPNNCFVVIAGDIDPDAAFQSVQRRFGDWPRKPYEPVILPDEPRQQSGRRARKTFATDVTRLAFGWPIPGETHEDKPALDVLAFLLGSGRSSRLYQQLREKQGIAHSVWAGAWAARECGLFHVEIECDPQDVGAAEASALDTIARLTHKGPNAAELEKAVRSTLGSQLRTLMTTRGQAMSLGHGWLMDGTLDFARQYLTAVERLTPRAIQQAAGCYLDPQRLNTVVVEAAAPAVPGARSAIKGKCETIQRFVLPNGLTLIVGQNPKLPLVSMRAQFLAGVPAETDATAGVTQVTAQLLMMGTRNHSAEELASALENRGGGILAQGDVHRLYLGAEVMRGDERLGLDLLADLALHPTLPPDKLNSIKKRQIAAIREEQEDPLTVALRLCRRKVFAGAPFARTALGTEASVQKLSAGDCRDLLARHVTGANGVVSVFGDVDAGQIQKWVAKAFARLPKGSRDVLPARAFARRGVAGEWEQRMEKEQAVVVVGFRTAGLLDRDTPALSLIDEACSDMGSRLFNRIREELGLAYYVGAQAFAAMGAGAFYFYVGTEPAKVDLAQREMMQQIESLAKNGLTADELGRAMTTWRSSWLRAQQGNTALADGTGWDELNGLGYRHFENLPAIMEQVSARDVREAAARHFGSSKAFVVRVLPA